jgi:hypothetical protein
MSARERTARQDNAENFGLNLPEIKGDIGQSKTVGPEFLDKLTSFTNSEGCRVVVFPGVKKSEVRGLDPLKWMNKVDLEIGRHKKGHGPCFTATTEDSEGHKFHIRCRSIRRHYRTTFEARMLLHLKEQGFNVEEPLAVVAHPKKGRMIVTREITGGKQYGPFTEVIEAQERLRKIGIEPTDLYEFGRQNYLYIDGEKPTLVLVDVEHYHSEDPQSKLHTSRMLKRNSNVKM